MSRTIDQHDYFGELMRGEFGGWTGHFLFPPTKKHVQIFISGGEKDLTVPPESVSFFDELILLYPEMSTTIQERFYELRDQFEDMKSKEDVWSIFQLEGIHLGVGSLMDCKYWRLIYGTDYGGHIFEFEMNGKNVADMSLEG